ncbi:uncharacterized protein LOC116265423 isoform X1 [Nymphaea colorata]|nr:uncharacterized protein LOC116265423 isoform X1 [Nymphaea colorata]
MVMCVVGRQNEPRRYIGVRVDEDMEVKVQGGARPKIVIQKVLACGQQVQDQSSYMTQESVEKQSSEANGVESKPQRDLDQKDQQDIQGQVLDTNQGSTNMPSPNVHEPLDQTRSNQGEPLEKLMRRHLQMKAMIYNIIEAQTQEILSFMEKQTSTEKHEVTNEGGNGRPTFLKLDQKGKMEVLLNNLTEDWTESSGAKDD